MTKKTRTFKNIEEFSIYLKTLSYSEVTKVWDKAEKAKRHEYAKVALHELYTRPFELVTKR
jgi:preprotein translocase subunit Sss1